MIDAETAPYATLILRIGRDTGWVEALIPLGRAIKSTI